MEITFSSDYLQAISDEAKAIDEQLAQANSPTAGKRAIINKLVEASTEDPSSLIGYIESISNIEGQIAFIAKLEKAIAATFNADHDAYLEAVVSSQPKVEMTDEQWTALVTKRKELAANWNALVQAWPIVNPTISIAHITPPAKMTGLRGARGARAISSYQFSLNGVALTAAENKLKAIAARFSKEDGTPWSSTDLRNFVVTYFKAQDFAFDWKNPPSVFTVTMQDGTVLVGQKMAEDTDDDGDED